jgi:CRISPR-associated exonuclease Cas4
VAYDEDQFLALSGIQHFVFCKRQWGLIHIEQAWQENALTVLGDQMHRRANDAEERERRGDLLILRGLSVRSNTLGAVGQCDVVECKRANSGCSLHGEEGFWSITPVEYKRGESKESDADRLQLCAQAICLEEMLACEIPFGELYYGRTRSREHVAFTDAMRGQVNSMFSEMHRCFERRHVPKAHKKAECRACSLVDVCMPKRMLEVEKYIEATLESE